MCDLFVTVYENDFVLNIVHVQVMATHKGGPSCGASHCSAAGTDYATPHSEAEAVVNLMYIPRTQTTCARPTSHIEKQSGVQLARTRLKPNQWLEDWGQRRVGPIGDCVPLAATLRKVAFVDAHTDYVPVRDSPVDDLVETQTRAR